MLELLEYFRSIGAQECEVTLNGATIKLTFPPYQIPEPPPQICKREWVHGVHCSCVERA